MSERLKGQVAIITGASRGLGQFCALGFANEGARVVIAARTEKEKDKRLPGTIYHTAEMINKAGANSGDRLLNSPEIRHSNRLDLRAGTVSGQH
jgi:NAD(P)-dependent dehydrogenase (short-subunit alcohol dehydrogenase family)